MSYVDKTESPAATLARLFVGREDALGTYDPATGRTWQEKRVVTLADHERHVTGERPLGIYPLIESRVKFAAVDFDTPDTDVVLKFAKGMGARGWYPHVERSKSKGYHCWFFFSEPIEAVFARATLHETLERVGGKGTEVFPKQDRLASGEYGNFINLPLFKRSVASGRTVFVDGTFAVIGKQWDYLQGAKLTPSSAVEVRRKATPLLAPAPASIERTWGLPPCMQRMLAAGVTEFQRVSCFRLAVALRKTGLPVDACITVLSQWSSKNRPQAGKRTITPGEIASQVHAAYRPGRHRGCGCDDPAVSAFCGDGCAINRNQNQWSP